MIIEILWRDKTAIAVNKPPGLLVHNSRWAGPKERSLRQWLADQIQQQVYPIHRLDRPTSGVLLYALSRETAQGWHDQLGKEDTQKSYLALVRGHFPGPMTTDHPLKDGKKRRTALTHFWPLAYDATTHTTLVQAMPRTGRQHQIRRHLAHLAHQILGDSTYGKGRINRYFRAEYGLSGLFLHACRLDITHPLTGERLCLQAALPPQHRRLLYQIFGEQPEMGRCRALPTPPPSWFLKLTR